MVEKNLPSKSSRFFLHSHSFDKQMVMHDNIFDTPHLANQMRTLQFIAFALRSGVLFFLGMVIYMVQQQEPNPDQPIMLSYLAFGVFAISLVLWWVVPELAVKSAVTRIADGTWTPGKDKSGKDILLSNSPTDASNLLIVYQTRTII